MSKDKKHFDAVADRILDALENESDFDAVAALAGVLGAIGEGRKKDPVFIARKTMELLGYKRKDPSAN